MPKNTLGAKLKRYRRRKEMTQEELAELLDVSNKSVSKWELGNGYPSKKNLMKIADILDVPFDIFLTEQQVENSRLKTSFQYAWISYCIIFALTLLIRGIRGDHPSEEVLSNDVIEIIKIVIVTFGEYIYTAIVPAIIIGLVFYFYIIPRQQHNECQ